MSDGVVVDWLGGNCPVQAEGTFDGVAFYFRARGTQVTCDVGASVKDELSKEAAFEWRGPEYEWPGAGWISEQVARAFIEEAYSAWRRRDAMPGQNARHRRHNGKSETRMNAILRSSGTFGPDTPSRAYRRGWHDGAKGRPYTLQDPELCVCCGIEETVLKPLGAICAECTVRLAERDSDATGVK